MAQNIGPKQLNFVTRLLAANQKLLDLANELASLKTEWDANAYATGAVPLGNNIADALLQSGQPVPFPSLSALVLNQLIGAHVAVTAAIATNRGYLEAART